MNCSGVKTFWLVLVILVAVMPVCAQENGKSAPVATSQSEATLALNSLARFEGKGVVHLKNGRSYELHLALRSVGIHGKTRIERFPEQGFLIVNLHSGRVVTVIDGKEEHRKGGDFWVVPAGSHMSVQVESESALLQTVAIQK
jgi:hypothetical protein